MKKNFSAHCKAAKARKKIFRRIARLQSSFLRQSTSNSNHVNNYCIFNDVLYGGFGVHDVDEKYILKWHSSEKSKSELKYYDRIIEIIKEHENIELQLN